MYYLIGVFALLIIVTGFVTYFANKKQKSGSAIQVELPTDEECCGAHEVCESDSLLSKSLNIEYYEDQELDGYKYRSNNSYSEDEISQFREVLYTLRENEVAGWLNSLRVLEIELPEDLRAEALLIVSERRFK